MTSDVAKAQAKENDGAPTTMAARRAVAVLGRDVMAQLWDNNDDSGVVTTGPTRAQQRQAQRNDGTDNGGGVAMTRLEWA